MAELFTPTFFAIWIGWLLAGGSPGPATLSISGTAMERGRFNGFCVSLGVLAGSASWGIASALGVGATMMANPWMFEVVRYAGALYLLWLAFKALKSALMHQTSLANTPFAGNPKQLFVKGALLHLTNPKAILSWASIYAIALPPNPSFVLMVQCFALLYVGSILVFVGYAFLFSSRTVVAIYIRMQRAFNLTFGAFFGFASFKILTAELGK